MAHRAYSFLMIALGIASNVHAIALGDGQRLDFSDLLSNARPAAFIDNRAFMPGPGAQAAITPFDGDLVLSETRMQTVPADLGLGTILGKDPQYFPAVHLSFITVDGDLVPTVQDVVRAGSLPGGRSYWDIIVQPGRVWSEPSDKGWSRAAFPFALLNSLEGETHNGLATFLYRGHEVSALRYQIVQQTLFGNVGSLFTAFGSAPSHGEAGAGTNAALLERIYRISKADAVPVRPWSDLERQVGSKALRGFAEGLPAEQTVLSGLDYQGTFYLHDCESSTGPLPWCDRARFGVWSVTKAFINEVALLRLAQKFGPDVFAAKIADYLPAARTYPAWNKVTFDDAINMATGIGNGSTRRNPNDIVDGYLDPTYNDWYNARSREDKMLAVLRTGHIYPWGPGQVVRYRDQDMYTLGLALDAYLKSKEGPTASLWAMLKREVYEPIGIHYATTTKTIEIEGEGAPIMSFGALATFGELVKVARLYQAGGRWDGKQILYLPRIDELKAGTAPRGLPTGAHGPFGETTYFNTFWQFRYDATEGCKLHIPQMVGWGSNTVTLYPGGITGIRIAHAPSDAADDPTPMARVANRLIKFCN